MMSLDRFEQGLPDIQDMPVIGTCKICGDSMYWHRDNMEVCDMCKVDIEFYEAMNSEEE